MILVSKTKKNSKKFTIKIIVFKKYIVTFCF